MMPASPAPTRTTSTTSDTTVGESRRRRTEVFLAAAAAARERPSRATYSAAAWAAVDLSTAYGWAGSCTYGNMWHPLKHVGHELMQRAIDYQHVATILPTA